MIYRDLKCWLGLGAIGVLLWPGFHAILPTGAAGAEHTLGAQALNGVPVEQPDEERLGLRALWEHDLNAPALLVQKQDGPPISSPKPRVSPHLQRPASKPAPVAVTAQLFKRLVKVPEPLVSDSKLVH